MPSLDETRLAQLRGLMPAQDFEKLRDLIRTDLQQRRGRLWAAFQAEDREGLEHEAHAVAGVAANSGAIALEALAREVMTLSQASPLTAVGQALAQLLVEEASVQRELDRLI